MEPELFSAVLSSVRIELQQQLPRSFVTTSFGRRGIRRHCWVCNDVWMDIFPFFDHAQLGLKLALLSPRFNALVDTHFDGKSELTIWRPIIIYKKGTIFTRHEVDEDIKHVQFPLPNKIRFVELRIQYIDHSVINFLHSNQQVFDRIGTNLKFVVTSCEREADFVSIWHVLARQICPIFAPNIRRLVFSICDCLNHLLRFISPTILTDLLNLSLIYFVRLSSDAIGDFNGGPNATSAGQALSKWLHTPKTDGQPKRLQCLTGLDRNFEWISNLKQAFLRAASSACYEIQFSTGVPSLMPIEPFELVNERTKEKLTLEKKILDEMFVEWLLKRCPIFGGTAATVRLEGPNSNNLNNIHFLLYGDNNCMGPLCPLAEDQINAKDCLPMNPGPSGQRKEN